MPTADPQTWERSVTDIDWVEEEAWRRASEWTITPALIFALKDLIEQERQKEQTNGSTQRL